MDKVLERRLPNVVKMMQWILLLTLVSGDISGSCASYKTNIQSRSGASPHPQFAPTVSSIHIQTTTESRATARPQGSIEYDYDDLADSQESSASNEDGQSSKSMTSATLTNTSIPIPTPTPTTAPQVKPPTTITKPKYPVGALLRSQLATCKNTNLALTRELNEKSEMLKKNEDLDSKMDNDRNKKIDACHHVNNFDGCPFYKYGMSLILHRVRIEAENLNKTLETLSPNNVTQEVNHLRSRLEALRIETRLMNFEKIGCAISLSQQLDDIGFTLADIEDSVKAGRWEVIVSEAVKWVMEKRENSTTNNTTRVWTWREKIEQLPPGNQVNVIMDDIIGRIMLAAGGSMNLNIFEKITKFIGSLRDDSAAIKSGIESILEHFRDIKLHHQAPQFSRLAYEARSRVNMTGVLKPLFPASLQQLFWGGGNSCFRSRASNYYIVPSHFTNDTMEQPAKPMARPTNPSSSFQFNNSSVVTVAVESRRANSSPVSICDWNVVPILVPNKKGVAGEDAVMDVKFAIQRRHGLSTNETSYWNLETDEAEGPTVFLTQGGNGTAKSLWTITPTVDSYAFSIRTSGKINAENYLCSRVRAFSRDQKELLIRKRNLLVCDWFLESPLPPVVTTPVIPLNRRSPMSRRT